MILSRDILTKDKEQLEQAPGDKIEPEWLRELLSFGIWLMLMVVITLMVLQAVTWLPRR